MTTISTQESLFASLGLSGNQAPQTATNKANELGLNTFLKLMVTQLNNQDPFKPMENGEFLSQIAQFGSVTGLEKLNQSFETLSGSITSGQALQAGSLVGREVLVPVETGYLAAGAGLRGQTYLEQSSPQVMMRVTDQFGQLIRESNLGSVGAGDLAFAWDGVDGQGNPAAPGLYSISLEAIQNDRPVNLQTQLFARVESVSLGGASGLTLNLAGQGPISFNNVKQIF